MTSEVLYVAEGGNQTERRKSVLEFVREIVEETGTDSFVLCGHVDEDIFRRLRPFQPILLHDVVEDSGFLLEELTYLCAHECAVLRAIGKDEFTTLFSLLRPDKVKRLALTGHVQIPPPSRTAPNG